MACQQGTVYRQCVVCRPGCFSHRSCAVILWPDDSDVQAIVPYSVHALNQGHTQSGSHYNVLRLSGTENYSSTPCVLQDMHRRHEQMRAPLLSLLVVAPNATGIEKVVYE